MIKILLIIYIIGMIATFAFRYAVTMKEIKKMNSIFITELYHVDINKLILHSLIWPLFWICVIIAVILEYAEVKKDG